MGKIRVAAIQMRAKVGAVAGCPKVTDAGVARLKKALPRCDIHR